MTTQKITHKQLHDLKDHKVLFVTPFYMSQGFSPFFKCLLDSVRVLDRLDMPSDTLFINGSSYVDHARNLAVMLFLNDAKYSDYTDLFFLDSDMEWDIEGMIRVISAPYDVVGSAYPMKNQWENYSVRHYSNPDSTPLCTDDGLIVSQLVPAGFMKISRHALTLMSSTLLLEPYHTASPLYEGLVYPFFECKVIDGNRYGEDSMFCRRWTDMGERLYCEPRVTFSHWGVHAWHGNYHNHLISLATATGE